MVIRYPVAPATKPADDLLVVGVEEMRTVAVDARAALIDEVVGITADMIALVQNGDGVSGLREVAGIGCSRKAGADDKNPLFAHRREAFGTFI